MVISIHSRNRGGPVMLHSNSCPSYVALLFVCLFVSLSLSLSLPR